MEKRLDEWCKIHKVKYVEPRHYYDTTDSGEHLKSDFSREALALRTGEDRIINIRTGNIKIDVKTTFRKDTGNISIELSSVFYMSKSNIEHIPYYFLVFDNSNNPLIFNKFQPAAIFIQPTWFGDIRKLWFEFADIIMRYYGRCKIIEKNTGGSMDPFVLISWKSVEANAILLETLI